MMTRLIILCLLSLCAMSVQAREEYILDFQLKQGTKVIEQGRLNLIRSTQTWSKGLKRSYLRLRCAQQFTGKLTRLYSTEDHFNGVTLRYQLVGNRVELNLRRSLIQARLLEIRGLAKNECREMYPLVSITDDHFSVPFSDNVRESFPFGENMLFTVELYSLE